ncbi:YihY family inner membrane protein OS=Streptomyces microflavus OX=1919 GN=Smic_79780 PE=4 SV=1 [Streptomyces microflavus]
MSGDELSGDEALAALRRYGRWPLVRDAFVRFRYADGFSHARALALQTILAIIPLVIAFVGLSTELHTESVGRLAELTIRGVSEGPSAQVVDDALNRNQRGDGDAALRSACGGWCPHAEGRATTVDVSPRRYRSMRWEPRGVEAGLRVFHLRQRTRAAVMAQCAGPLKSSR